MTNRTGIDIIYHGYFPMYEPYLAALIHVGITNKLYPIDSYFELCNRRDKKFGDLIYIGMDEEFNRVYAMGCKGFDSTLIKSQDGFRNIYDIGTTAHYIDTHKIEGHIPHIIYRMQDSGFFNNTARGLFYYWYRNTYSKALSLVERERIEFREGR